MKRPQKCVKRFTDMAFQIFWGFFYSANKWLTNAYEHICITLLVRHLEKAIMLRC